MMNRPCCFLDRDGVINEEINYLHEADKVVILPGVVPALRRLNELGIPAVVVTNQGGVARGLYGEDAIASVHARIEELLARDSVTLTGFYYCVHHDRYSGPCPCRKPHPGMLLKAADELGIDLAHSCMIGDRGSDVAAGLAAGCPWNYLVRTGYGETALAEGNVPDQAIVTDDILSAVLDFAGRSGLASAK